MVGKNLLEEYIKYFGDKPPIPPDNIMRTLVKMKTDGTFEEKLEQFNSINDEFCEWYENGNKKTEGNFKGEKKDGLWIRWYENGQKKMEVGKSRVLCCRSRQQRTDGRHDEETT